MVALSGAVVGGTGAVPANAVVPTGYRVILDDVEIAMIASRRIRCGRTGQNGNDGCAGGRGRDLDHAIADLVVIRGIGKENCLTVGGIGRPYGQIFETNVIRTIERHGRAVGAGGTVGQDARGGVSRSTIKRDGVGRTGAGDRWNGDLLAVGSAQHVERHRARHTTGGQCRNGGGEAGVIASTADGVRSTELREPWTREQHHSEYHGDDHFPPYRRQLLHGLVSWKYWFVTNGRVLHACVHVLRDSDDFVD